MSSTHVKMRYKVASAVVGLSWVVTGLTTGQSAEITSPIKDINIVESDTIITDRYAENKVDVIYDPQWSPTEKHRKAEELLAGVLFGECRGQSIYCMMAVGHVTMNRARMNLDRRYGKGLWGVLNKRKQFSCLNHNDPNRKVIMKAISGKLKAGTKDAEKWKLAKRVAHFLMHRNEGDPTLGSTHYHSIAIHPKWVKDRGMVFITKIDGHKFYRKDG